jgi:hypothetical protein
MSGHPFVTILSLSLSQVSKAVRIRRGGGALDVDDYQEDGEDEAALQKEVAKVLLVPVTWSTC